MLKRRLSCLHPESTGVGAAGAATRAASVGLEPADELVNGEGLRESGAGAGAGAVAKGGSRSSRGGRSRGDGFGLLDWGGNGASDGCGRLGGSGGRDRRGRGLGWGARSRGASGRGAVPDLGAGDLVAGGVVVQVEQDAGVGGGVGLGHVGASGRERDRSRAGDLDLTAAIVELGATFAAGLVETNDLRADPVVARLQVGDVDGDETLVLNEFFDSPLSVSETLLPDLGPDSALALALSRCHVDHDRTIVRSGDWLVRVAGREGVFAVIIVVPLHADRGTSSHFDLVCGGLSTIANHGGGCHILDRVVSVRGGLDSKVVALVLSVDDEALEGGVSSNEVGSGQNESSGGLHGDDSVCLIV